MHAARPTQRTAIGLLTGLGLLVLFFVLTGGVVGAGQPTGAVPGYPIEGCYGVVTVATGMWDGTGQITVDVPGPVVDAYLWWAGAFEAGGADLTVNGQVVVGEHLARLVPPPGSLVPPPDWHLWRADLGPDERNLVVQGLNTLAISDWEGNEAQERNGATLTVIYATPESPCLHPVEIQVHDYLDYMYRYFYDSELRVYPIVPAPRDRVLTATISFAGTDAHPIACREFRVLYSSGENSPPTQSLHPVNNVIAVNPLWQTSPCQVTTHPPATSLGGGYVGAEWSVFTLTINVQANHKWVAFQLDSVDACSGGACGESGAWIGTVLEMRLPKPELAITKTDNETSVVPGQTLTYTIHYHNAGDRTAKGVQIVDTLPGRSEFVSCYGGTGANCTYSNGHVVILVGDLDPGQNGVAKVVVKLDDLFPAGRTSIINRARISTATPGDDPANNTAMDVDVVTGALDLAIAKSGPPVAAPGDSITYLITATVTGNAWADNARITDPLPDNTTFAGCDPACELANDLATWPIGRVTPGDTVSVTLSVTLTSPLTNGLVITNTASIAAPNVNPATSPPVTTTVNSNHSLVIEKSAVQNPVFASQLLTYTIDWGVTGNEPAPNVVITDVIPAGTTFYDVSEGCLHDQPSNTVICRLPNQTPPVTGAVALTVTVNEPPISLIDNTAVICDDDPETTCASDSPDDPYLLSHIDGLVWLDENGDGLPLGELGIPSVAMTLTVAGPGPACPGLVPHLATTLTGASGLYGFLPLQRERFTYCVDIAEPTLPILCPVRTTPAPDPILLPPGASRSTIDFGYQSNPARVSGTVFKDLDQDTIQDEDERGLVGVTICLRDAGDDDQCGTSDDGSPECMVTPPSGEYSFGELTPGVYCVSAPALQGRRLTTPEDSTVQVGVEACGAHADQDFGYSGVYTVSLSLADSIPSVGTRASAQITVTYEITSSRFISGQSVDLRVEGVHSRSDDLITDRNGKAAYAYYYAVPFNRAGQDTVTAWLDWDPNQALNTPPEPSDDATVNWQPVSLAVDYQCSVSGNCCALRTFTAIISKRQIPALGVSGISAAFVVTGGTSVGPTAMDTGSDGKAVFSYTSTAPPGPETRAARLPDDLPSCSGGGNPLRNPDARDSVRLWVDLNRNLVFDHVIDGEPACIYDLVTAITLASFTAEPAGMASVRLNWETAVEIDSAGFNLHRAIAADGPYTRLNPLLIAATGAGGGASYSYIDTPPGPRVYFYKLEEVDVYGESTFYDPVSVAFLTSWPKIFLPTILR